MTWWWLRWHRRHGQVLRQYVNPAPVVLTVLDEGVVTSARMGGERGRIVDGVLELGPVDLVPELACPCGKTRREP